MSNYTSKIATMGTINAAIAPSSDLIQQLLCNTKGYVNDEQLLLLAPYCNPCSRKNITY